MTTIAWRDGILAGDGRETIQNDESASYVILNDNCVKVHRLSGGRLFGAAHGSEDIERLLDALRKGKKPPKLEDVAGLLVDRQDRLWLYEGRIWQSIPLAMGYYSVGSGSVFALAALDAGATAEEAVRIAAKRDPFSGGLITTITRGK